MQGSRDYFTGWSFYHPLIVDGIVFVAFQRDGGSTNGILAVNATTGDSQVLFETEETIRRPHIVDGTLYAVINGSVVAYSLKDGTQKWRSQQIAPDIAVVRRVHDTVVAYIDFRMVVLDAETGEAQWSVDGDNFWGGYLQFPVITDGTVVRSRTTQIDAKFRSLDNGRVQREIATPYIYPVLSNGEFYSLPFPNDGVISYNWNTLKRRWRTDPTGSGQDERLIMGGHPIVHDDVVVVNERGTKVRGLDRETGEHLWSTKIPYLYRTLHATDSDTVYLSCRGGSAVAIDPQNGDIKWSYQPPGAGSRGSGIALADDLLVIVDQSGTVTALE